MDGSQLSETVIQARQLQLFQWQTIILFVQLILLGFSVWISKRCSDIAKKSIVIPYAQTIHMKQIEAFMPISNQLYKCFSEINNMRDKIKPIDKYQPDQLQGLKSNMTILVDEFGKLIDCYDGNQLLFVPLDWAEKLHLFCNELIGICQDLDGENIEGILKTLDNMEKKIMFMQIRLRETLGLDNLQKYFLKECESIKSIKYSYEDFL